MFRSSLLTFAGRKNLQEVYFDGEEERSVEERVGIGEGRKGRKIERVKLRMMPVPARQRVPKRRGESTQEIRNEDDESVIREKKKLYKNQPKL